MRIGRPQRRGETSWKYAIFFLWTFLGAVALPAQQRNLPQEKRQAIEKAVASFTAANRVPGLSAAVVLEGEPCWSDGFGMADLENYSPTTSSTLFRLGSVSKPISAAAVLHLWESGKLDLDAPVQKYCSAFPQKEWPITTRELLGHLGGIRHYSPNGKGDVPEDSARHFSSMQESLQLFANDPLVAKPGTKFNYSTYGYTLVGCVLEGAASEKFIDYVRKNVFEPAGMAQTRDDDYPTVILTVRAGITKTSPASYATPESSIRVTKSPAAESSLPRMTWRSSKPPSWQTSSSNAAPETLCGLL